MAGHRADERVVDPAVRLQRRGEEVVVVDHVVERPVALEVGVDVDAALAIEHLEPEDVRALGGHAQPLVDLRAGAGRRAGCPRSRSGAPSPGGGAATSRGSARSRPGAAGRRARSGGGSSVPRASSLGSGSMIDAVVTHHRDSFRSGVGRFNELLARAARRAGDRDPQAARGRRARGRCSRSRSPSSRRPRSPCWSSWSSTKPFEWELFLHVYDGRPVEEALVRGAARVHAGNHEVARGGRAAERARSTRSGRRA